MNFLEWLAEQGATIHRNTDSYGSPEWLAVFNTMKSNQEMNELATTAERGGYYMDAFSRESSKGAVAVNLVFKQKRHDGDRNEGLYKVISTLVKIENDPKESERMMRLAMSGGEEGVHLRS